MPDGFAVKEEGEEAFFFDAKSGPTIEKDPPTSRIRRSLATTAGVFVFIRNGDDTYCVPIRKLKFLDSWDCVRSFPPDRQMPVDEDGWIAPPALAGSEVPGVEAAESPRKWDAVSLLRLRGDEPNTRWAQNIVRPPKGAASSRKGMNLAPIFLAMTENEARFVPDVCAEGPCNKN